MTKKPSAIWFANHACNMRCEYCWQNERPLPKLQGTLNDWLLAWNKIQPRVLDVTGGEPLAIPWMIEFLQKVNIPYVAMTTNLSENIVDLIRRVPATKLKSLTVSWHPTQRMNLEDFTGRAMLLKHRGYRVTVNFVTWPEQVHMMAYYREWFTSRGLIFHVDPYAPASSLKTLLPDAREQEMIAQAKGSDRGPHPWAVKYGRNYTVLCDAGMNHMCVQPDGTLYRCLTEFVEEKSPLGNILHEDFTLSNCSLPCYIHYTCAGCDRDKVRPELIP